MQAMTSLEDALDRFLKIKSLMTSTGNPMSPSHIEEFEEVVDKYFPEFRKLELGEKEEKIFDLINDLINKGRLLKEYEFNPSMDYYERVSLYEVPSKKYGKIYIVEYTWEHAPTAEAGVSYGFYKSYKEAFDHYEDIMLDLKEKERSW